MIKLDKEKGFFSNNEKVLTTIQSIANKYCNENEVVYVGIKGAFKEYLIASDKKIYIYKFGYMTGHTFGFSIFQLDYSSVSAIQLHKQFGGAGYIEIVGIGMQNRENLSYWTNDKKNMASRCDNCLTFGGGSNFYDTAVKKLNELLMISKNNVNNLKNTSSLNKFEEIKQYKELFDSGIITAEEFEIKKNELLNI
ncbi:MAG: SHOCT domain-containing protein [Anaerococcus vaginalis]|nr:SHOCT domain-containing protein [Anaerococcus vaginalis]